MYVKIRTETDEAALAGIDPMMGNDDDETDTKEEFVLCAFIGNAVESTSEFSLERLLRIYGGDDGFWE